MIQARLNAQPQVMRLVSQDAGRVPIVGMPQPHEPDSRNRTWDILDVQRWDVSDPVIRAIIDAMREQFDIG